MMVKKRNVNLVMTRHYFFSENHDKLINVKTNLGGNNSEKKNLKCGINCIYYTWTSLLCTSWNYSEREY
jgi:hypothetical protein